MVNVLDVPVHENVLLGARRKLSSGSFESVVFTLDPQDKYLPSGVRRASTTSAVHARKAGLPTTTRPLVQAQRDGSIETESVVLQTSKRIHDASVPQRQHSLLSIFHQMRQTRSAGSNAKSSLAWPRKIFSRAGKSTKQGAPDHDPGSAKQLGRAVSTSPTKIWGGSNLPNYLPSTAETEYRAATALMINLANPNNNNTHPSQQLSCSEYSQQIASNKGDQGFNEGDITMSARDSGVSFWSSDHAPTEQLGDTLSYCASAAAEKRNVMALSDHFGRLDFAQVVSKAAKDPTKLPFDDQNNSPNALHSTELRETFELNSKSPGNGYPDSLASYAASANFSPYLGSNTTQSGVISPCHLSQPETPVTSEYGDELPPFLHDPDSLAQMSSCTSSEFDLPLTEPFSRARPPNLPRLQQDEVQASHATWGGFQGYSLPDHDHASVNTIRKIPSFTPKSKDASSPFSPQSSKQDLGHTWDNVSEHHMTALGELVEDLGYLGKVII